MDFLPGHYVVMGSASGIGRAVAESLIRLNIPTVTSDRLAPSIPGAVASFAVDVADEHAVAAMATRLPRPLAGVILTAGILTTGSIEQMSAQDMVQLLMVNLMGPCLVAKHLGPLLEPRGSMVLTASELAFVGTADSPVYSATKGGVVSLCRSLAVAWRDREIRVNALCPGATDTPLIQATWHGNQPSSTRQRDESGIPWGRLATPEEVAGAGLFLLSRQAAFVNGHALVADGGAIIW